MSSRASAITAAGSVLSQPTRQTRPSNRWPAQTSSIESAITSREISDARMPSVPIETPSETEIVLNSIGVPPASRMPCLTWTASSRWLRLHGIVSIHVVQTPTSGFARSSSVKPVPFSIARAAARSGPSVSAALRRFAGSLGRSYGLSVTASGSLGRRGQRQDRVVGEALAQLGRGGLAVVAPDDDGRPRAGQRHRDGTGRGLVAEDVEVRRGRGAERLVQAIPRRRREQVARA